MDKKILGIIIGVAGVALIGFILLGTLRFSGNKTVFENDGYVMGDGYGDSLESQKFLAGTEYRQDREGNVSFSNTDKKSVQMPSDSFAKYDSGNFTAFEDGLILKAVIRPE